DLAWRGARRAGGVAEPPRRPARDRVARAGLRRHGERAGPAVAGAQRDLVRPPDAPVLPRRWGDGRDPPGMVRATPLWPDLLVGCVADPGDAAGGDDLRRGRPGQLWRGHWSLVPDLDAADRVGLAAAG